ncbi:unnamed protein product [marine sediment metagenome]|uniref:Uncharacterized protein n=1 Tax=marine sediment metagenome TaxID=412755 RepID=X1TCV6_9ZZZZ
MLDEGVLEPVEPQQRSRPVVGVDAGEQLGEVFPDLKFFVYAEL